jgi:hypothetical protein
MRVPKHPTLSRRSLQSRLKQLASSGPLLAASLCSYPHRCGRPSCRCHHGGPLHSGQHLTFPERGKTRSVYVPQDLLAEVRLWIARHRHLKEILRIDSGRGGTSASPARRFSTEETSVSRDGLSMSLA